MEINTKFFSFKTGKNKDLNTLVKKSDPSDNLLPDEFYTTLSNFIHTNSLSSSLDMLLYFFNNVTEINSIVTYIAQKGSDIPIKHVKKAKGNTFVDLGETDEIKLLNKPNHLNDGRVFKINAISSFFVFGFIPINKIKPIGWPSYNELFLLPGNNFYPIPEKSVNMYGLPPSGTDFRTNYIKKYRQFIDARPFDFMPEDIILMNDSNLSFDNGAYLKGQSRLASAIRSIKALSDLYDTVNTLISNKGAAGFLTNRVKSGVLDTGWDEADRKNVEEKLYAYGTSGGRRPIGVTNKDLGFIRLSVPISEFMPIELKNHEYRTIASALMFPSILGNDNANSIYNNAQLAQKAFYSDCLIPVVNLFYQGLSNGLGLTDRGEALIPDYSKIEALSEDKKSKIETEKLSNDLWFQRYEDNIITLNEYLRAIGLKEVPNGNVFAKESSTIANQLGDSGVKAIQGILSDTSLTISQKFTILKIVFGFKDEDAKLMSGA